MSAAATAEPKELGPRRIDEHLPALTARAVPAIGVGALGAVTMMVWPELRQHFFPSYLVAATFLLTISLGALWFVILQHLVRAGWSVLVRRVAEGMAMNLLWVWILFLPVLGGMAAGKLHPWAAHHDEAPPAAAAGHDEGGHGEAAHEEHGGGGAHHALEGSKAAYLSMPAFTVRLVVYFLLWIGMAVFFCGNSRRQDESGDPALTSKMQWWAPPAMIVFALSTSLFGFDVLMSLDPHWYSTIFGVWFFAGCAVSFFAALILAVYLLQRRGLMREITVEHYHDAGKLMFGMTVFWAYVSFSQFMLQWYGNIPEETVWYQRRIEGGWLYVSWWVLIGHFCIPFLASISRWPKRRPHLIVLVALWMLGMHYVDLFWIVLPTEGFTKDGEMAVPLLDLALLVSMGGLYAFMTGRMLSGKSLIPERDPRLGESLAFVNY